MMSVKRVTSSVLPTKYGRFKILGYEAVTRRRKSSYVVLVKGELGTASTPLVRIHSQCLTGDVFASTRCDCGDQLKFAMREINKAGNGVIIYHPEEGRGIGLLNKLLAYELQDKGADTVEANRELGFEDDERDYAACAEILQDLGVLRIRLLSNNPQKLKALESAGLQVLERVSIEMTPRRSRQNYMKTKKEKLGHLLTKV
jgi:3,4-dihydroxy 2-butanone 4-phosphate synthase / GTP cyclohydrolase II